jgi:acetyl-CoA carboxylase alpha subunit
MANDISLLDAISSLRVGSQFTIRGDILEWLDTEQTEPTQEEIDAEIKRLQAEYDALQYQRDRQYPSIGDQLDTLFHDMTAGNGTKDGEWYKAIEQVKADNPKPE